METLQRMVSRHISVKNKSKRLKPVEESMLGSGGNQRCPNGGGGAPKEGLTFTSPFHLYEEEGTGAEGMDMPNWHTNGWPSAADGYRLERGALHGGLHPSKSEGRFAHLQQPLQKVLKASSAIRDKFPSTGSLTIRSNCSGGGGEMHGDPECQQGTKKKAFMMGQARVVDMRNKLSGAIGGRRSKPDGQNLLMMAEDLDCRDH